LRRVLLLLSFIFLWKKVHGRKYGQSFQKRELQEKGGGIGEKT
jgi:hypothetical protein